MSASEKTLHRIKFLLIFLIITVSHFLVTFVVALFLLSTLNILNSSIFHLENLRYVEIAVSAALFLVSAIIFFRSYEKISQFIKNTFFRKLP